MTYTLRPARSRIQRFWESIVLNERPFVVRILIQTSVIFGWFTLTNLIHQRLLGIYTSAIAVLVVAVLALFEDITSALIFSVVLTLAADYFFIPPLGSALAITDRENFDRYLVISVVAVIVNLLMYSLRLSFRKSLIAGQESERATDAMERMLALVSHDVRNPLTSIKMMAQLIQQLRQQPDRCEEFALRISEVIDRTDGMIQTLLDVSRLRAGQSIALEFSTCDLHAVVSQTVDEFESAHIGRFRFTSSGPLFGLWSPDGIRRAIENLIVNALKYGDQEGAIEVALHRVSESALITVHNKGKAIPRNEQTHLFDYYYRVNADTQVKGWGLGLTLVKGIADAHQGDVTVSSEAGTGTTFTLKLPIKANQIVSSLRLGGIGPKKATEKKLSG